MKKLFIFLVFISTYSFGQSITNFSGLDVTTNKTISLSNYSNKKAITVIFTSNVCPYSIYYEGRITQLIADYSDDVQFILINSHTEDKESESEMKNKISAWGIKIPYISDKSSTILKSFAARKSPEVYLLKPENGKFSIFYKGAIDNNPQVANDVKEPFLKKNIESLLSNKPAIVTSTRPIGCIIK